MVIKVGINSFGRIGRVIFRTCCENSEIEVAAINDPAIDLGYMCYLIKFDSTHGKYTGSVSHEGNEIKVNDRPIKVFHYKAPADIPWHEAGVQYVVEASGMFTSVEKASGHLCSDGVRRVIVTAPSADGPMLILGVNECAIQPDMKVVSCASSTLYCLAPIVKVLEDAFGVSEGFLTSIHAMTPSLKPLDGLCVRGKHWRDHRSIHQNIIPASTGACRALGRVLPACAGKLAGLAFRVPVVSVSVLDLCVRLNKNTTIHEITQIIEKLQNTALGNIIQVSNEKTVSSDFIGETHSCILDVDSSLQIKPDFFKLICWYENEYSYSCRVIDTVIFSERQFHTHISPSTRVMYMRPLSFDSNNDHKHTENSPANERRQYFSFCVPNLNSRSNMKSSPKNELGQSTDPEKRAQSIKSFIDRFTKCNCNVTQKNTSILETSRDQPEDKKHEKRQGCLKIVEKEISEMLSMTENLLNKSSNRKLQSVKPRSKKGSSEFSIDRNIMRKNIIDKISDTLEKIRKEKMNTPNIDMKGDDSLILDVDDYQDKVSLSARQDDSLNNSLLKLPTYNSPLINKVVSSNVSMEKSNSWVYWDSSTPKINLSSPMTDGNQSQITKERKTVMDNKTIVREGEMEHVKISPSDDRTNEVNYTKSEIRDNLEDEIELWNATPKDNIKVKRDEESKNNNDSNSTLRNYAFLNESISTSRNVVLDSMTENDQIVRLASQGNEKEETISEPVTEDDNDNNGDELADDKALGNAQALPGSSSTTIDNISESMSGIISNYTVNSACKNNGPNVDIYDKLDSESMSDSDSSFRIREKTSQVIRITDLTYSLEDLARLDKLCRVIEISDELSDKLFSPLDSQSHQNTARRNWSFQDLCERIKFDEFCNELFEKRAS